MLAEALALMLDDLNRHIHQAEGHSPGGPDIAVCGNAGRWEDAALTDRLVVSLLSLEEEPALRNGRAATRAGLPGEHRPSTAPLSMLLIFAANFASYTTALQRIEHVVTFFRNRPRFDLGPEHAGDPVGRSGPSFTVTQVPLSLVDNARLWSALGGEILPSAVYRLRLVTGGA